MYVKVINNHPVSFPYTLTDLRRDNPGTSFPVEISNQNLSAFDVYPVTPSPVPNFDSKTHYIKQDVRLVAGAWTQVWHLQKLPETQASANVRGERNRLLADCDWTQLADAPIDTAAWSIYRQKLRDLTAQSGFPWDVEWPPHP